MKKGEEHYYILFTLSQKKKFFFLFFNNTVTSVEVYRYIHISTGQSKKNTVMIKIIIFWYRRIKFFILFINKTKCVIRHQSCGCPFCYIIESRHTMINVWGMMWYTMYIQITRVSAIFGEVYRCIITTWGLTLSIWCLWCGAASQSVMMMMSAVNKVACLPLS